MYGGNYNNVQFAVPQVTGIVRILLIANISAWIGLVLVIQQVFMSQPYIFRWFGLVPDLFVTKFFIWQPVTYMFLHSPGVFHILFNMLLLWLLGSELEQRWGARFFLLYYMVCGIGAAIIYTVGVWLYVLIGGGSVAASVMGPLNSPVVGASGAVFGLILAYGIIFGERIIYFMMIFPMKAKYFVMILGAIELITLLNGGFGRGIANLAHLGGIAAGYLFLRFWVSRGGGRSSRGRGQKRGRRLHLVVNNERDAEPGNGPRYWN